MAWDCPKCGLVNPPEALVCDCGYNRVALAPGPARPRGWFATYQAVRLVIGGLACAAIGVGMLAWEASEQQPSAWAVVRSVLIILFGLGLVGMVAWLWTRPR